MPLAAWRITSAKPQAASAVEELIAEPDVEAQIDVAVLFHQLAARGAALARPVVVLDANGQPVLLVEVHDAAIEAAAGVVEVDRLDARAAALVVFVLGDAHLRAIGAPVQL